MARRTPRQSRALGLWTAAWLFGLLLVLLLWLGDPALQWPVLLVPALWAVVAARPRRGSAAVRRRPAERWDDDPDDWPPVDDDWPPAADDRPRARDAWPRADDRARPPSPREPRRQPREPRRQPPTRELPWLPEVPRDRREE
ncbi:hypothetical protein [Geodermatophilus sp. SYSU D00815]